MRQSSTKVMEDQLTSEIDLMLKEVDGLLSGGPQLSVLSSRDLEAAVASADSFVSKYSAEFMASAGQVKADGRWRQVAQSFDSLSMTTMWNVDELPSPLPDGWKWIAKGGSVQGAGNKSTRCEGRLEILEYKFTNLGTPVTIRPAVLKLPRHVVCVVGSKDMLSSDGGFDIMMDLANFRVYVISLHEIVRLDWLPRVICRLNSEPVNMIAWYGGLNPEVSVAKDLGWRVNMVFNIESDRMAREISSGNHDEVRHSDVVDARNVTIDHLPDGVNWFGVTGGPPCQLSSRRNSSPQKDTALFECMMHVMHKLLEEQDFNQLYENVVPNTDLVGIREEWDEIIALPSQRHEALDSAAMARRDRLYWSDSVDFESLQKFRHRCPEVCLSPGWHFEQRPPPPLLASGDRTEHKVWLIQENTNFRRTADSDERDRIHPALKAGISGDGIAEVRNIGNGNAFSADVFWHVMREWRIDSELHVPVSLMTADDVYAATPDQIQLYFKSIDTSNHKGVRLDAIIDVMRNFARKQNMLNENTGLFITPKMRMVLNEQETIPYKVPHACDVPALLTASAAYQIAKMCSVNEMGRRSHDMPNGTTAMMWVCMLFFQPKGRKVEAEFDDPYWGLYKKGDMLEAVRPLKNMKPVNAACSDKLPMQWSEFSPDRMTEYRKIPHNTTHFKKHDASDAYHAVDLEGDTCDLCVSKCRLLGRIIVFLRALCGSQGNAWMGTFFPAWIAYCYSFFLGDAWMEFWLQHTDDSLCHGSDEDICQLRWELMYACQVLSGLSPTAKYDSVGIPPVMEDDHVGLHWTGQGHRVADKSVELMKLLIQKVPQGGVQAQKLRGLINQSLTLLAWTQETKHQRMKVMIPINETVAKWQAKKEFLWGPEQKEAVQLILDMIDVTPRAYAHPDWVCSKNRCLVGQGDWDPAGISWHLFSVAKADASEVTPEDLHNPDVCVMLCMHTKAYNESQKKWNAYEGEMDAQMMGAVRKCGGYINTCLAPFKDPKIPKYAWGSDSKITLYRIPKLTLPELKIQYLCAKVQRFSGWSDESAMTRYWASCRLFTPDIINNLADACARIADQMRKIRPDLVDKDPETVDRSVTTETEEVTGLSPQPLVTGLSPQTEEAIMTCMPVSVHTFHQPLKTATQEMPRAVGFPLTLPHGTAAYTLLMSDEQWGMVSSAYAQDHTETCGVRMAEIFQLMHNNPAEFNSSTTNKVKQWKGRVIFPLDIAAKEDGFGDSLVGDSHQVLYTPCAATKTVDGSHEGAPDLVLVVPDACQVRLSGVALEDFPFKPKKDQCDWAKWYLREDLIWLAHSCGGGAHCSLTATIGMLKQQVWWQSMEDDVRRFVDACSQCLPLRISLRAVNMALVHSGRFSWVQMDDTPLSPKLQELTGYCSVLTFTEVPQGITVNALRKTKTAREVCVLFVTRWIAYYSCPILVSSDLDPALIGKLMSFLNRRLGIDGGVKQAQGLKCNQVENRQRIVNEGLAAAEAKGDIVDAATLQLAVGAAQIKAMQVIVTDRATVFERTHGVPPNTMKQLIGADQMTVDQLQAAIAAANPEDVNVMRSLSNRCDELLKFHLQKMDQRAKYNQLHLLSKQAGKRGADYGFQVGDKAAVNDQVVTIVKVPPAFAECRPTSMNVEFADGKRKDVMTSKLRPLAVDRFENTNRTSLPNTGMEVGDLIFYQSGSDQDGEGLLAGVITMIADEQIEVQIHQPKLGVSTWLPRWEDPMHLHKILRFRACPKGCHPFTDRLVEDQIVSTGEFSGPGYRLTDDTIYHLRSMGYDVELQADSEDKDVDVAACLAFEDESFCEMFPNS